MNWANVIVFGRHFWQTSLVHSSFYLLYAIFLLLTAYAAVSSTNTLIDQNTIRNDHQRKARQSWEANPDKHPHRMAHFGTFAFRVSPPLAMFDHGLESYTGSTVFLEAHRQNSVNFSNASFSTGTLRFGEMSLALLLQLVLPLILFFIGFSTIAADRENGTLKLLLSQGATWLELLVGKSLGLFGVGLFFTVPIFVIVVLVPMLVEGYAGGYPGGRIAMMAIGYSLFLWIVSVITIVVSARSSTAKNALIQLLGIWLLAFILLPRSAQALGNYWFPTPSKLSFESAIEKEVIKKGDSHNPNDPFFNQLRDSVLKVHSVAKVTDLPFNYAGFVMRQGEEVSSQLYKKHYSDLLKTYERQNNVPGLLAFINPYMAIKEFSMVMAGTDFDNYINFQEQADTYRYELAQTMNELQMEYISPKKSSGSEGKTHVVDHGHWERFPDFEHEQISFGHAFKSAVPSILAILLWTVFTYLIVTFTSKRIHAL